MSAFSQHKIDELKQLHLLQYGWCVVDGAFGTDMASKFLDEMQTLEKAKLFLPNKVQFTVQSNGQSVPLVVTKPHIFEVDLHDQSKRKLVPTFDQLFCHDILSDVMQHVEDKMKHLSKSRHTEKDIRTHGHVSATTAASSGATTHASSDSNHQPANMSHSDATQVTWQDQHYRWSKLGRGTKSKTIKLQINYGGAFPFHFDNPGPPNKRR